ncbi:MAG: Membrane protein-like protein [Bacteriovoracaceae bacterium]|nr:Membrane protein-like protein [Bacteriovoracaceae bacterium]
MRKFSFKSELFVWIFILAYIAVFSIFTVLRHHRFETAAWDLGIFDQSFWNALHGRGFTNTLELVPNHLGVHFSVFLYLLLPIYALFSSPDCLLIVQTIALALGAWPVFLIGRKMFPVGPWPVLLSLAYLLFPSLEWTNTFDFHEIAFFIPLFIFAIYFLLEEKWRWMTLFLILSGSTKEDSILVIFFLALYLFREPKTRKMGSMIMLISLASFLMITRVLMPLFGGGLLFLDRYDFFHPLQIFESAKFSYLFWLFFPVLFLPLLFPASLLLLLVGLAENILTNYKYQFSGRFHYDSILIPGIIFGAAMGLLRLLKFLPRIDRPMRWVFVSVVLISFLIRSPLMDFNFSTIFLHKESQNSIMRTLTEQIPEDVSIAANTYLIPHLTHRKEIYLLGREPKPADLVLVDSHDDFGFSHSQEFQKYVDQYAKNDLYESRVIAKRFIFLFRKVRRGYFATILDDAKARDLQ